MDGFLPVAEAPVAQTQAGHSLPVGTPDWKDIIAMSNSFINSSYLGWEHKQVNNRAARRAIYGIYIQKIYMKFPSRLGNQIKYMSTPQKDDDASTMLSYRCM